MAEKEAGECGAGLRKEAVILKTAEKEKKQTDTPPASPENSANPLFQYGASVLTEFNEKHSKIKDLRLSIISNNLTRESNFEILS